MVTSFSLRFGMFVDIGSKRDGLVHVKDISKDYFINNHQSVRKLIVVFLLIILYHRITSAHRSDQFFFLSFMPHTALTHDIITEFASYPLHSISHCDFNCT